MKDISYIDKIVKQHRTNLHKLAELSHEEFNTAKYIRDYLDKLGIQYETPLETATVGIIKGNEYSFRIFGIYNGQQSKLK